MLIAKYCGVPENRPSSKNHKGKKLEQFQEHMWQSLQDTHNWCNEGMKQRGLQSILVEGDTECWTILMVGQAATLRTCVFRWGKYDQHLNKVNSCSFSP